MNKPKRLRLLLSCLLILASALTGLLAYAVINSILQPQNTVEFPFHLGSPWPTVFPSEDGLRTGLTHNDILVSVDGKAFSGVESMLEAAASRQHGDSVPIVVRKQSGETASIRVPLRSPKIKTERLRSGLVAVVTLGFPLLGLSWAFRRAFKQPLDSITWLYLGCAISLQHLLAHADPTWPYPPKIAAIVYLANTILGQSFVMFALLLALYVPQQMPRIRSHRWVEWLLIALSIFWISICTIGNANKLFSSSAGNSLIALQQTLGEFSYVISFAFVALICSLILARFSSSI